MLSIPEWAPNVHPMIVHFPLVLLFVAAAVDALALAFRVRWPGLRLGATGLYTAGAATALAAFFSGRAAATSVMLPPGAIALLAAHAEWAERTVWFFGVYAVGRRARDWRLRRPSRPRDATLLIAGALGLALLFGTGERGARLVYEQGVGVAAVEVKEGTRHDHSHHGGAGAEEAAEGHSQPHEGVQSTDHGHAESHGDEE